MRVHRRAILATTFFVTMTTAAALGTTGRGADEVLKVPADAILRLERLRSEPKFQAQADGMYTGVHDVDQRIRAEAVINRLINSIEIGLPKTPTKQFILTEISSALDKLDLFDTEDRERACSYMESIMDCVGLESSDGLLNTWLYGFDPHAKH